MSKELFEQLREKEFYEVFGIDHSTGNLIESLLLNSAIPVNIEREIFARLYADMITEEEGQRIIDYLNLNQRDRISGGFRYDMTDIKYKLKNGKDIE